MATRLIAVAIIALTILPIANWLPGGETDPDYAARTIDWVLGLALCVGVGGLVAYLVHVWVRDRRIGAETSRPDVDAPLTADRISPRQSDVRVGSAGSGFAWLAALGAGLLYAYIAQVVFSGKPLLIDEIIQVMQARWYADGRLWVTTPQSPEFYSVMHLVDLGPKTYGQFPAGGPAMLALGSLVGLEWMVGPVAGALSVRLFAVLLEGLEPTASRRWHRGAIALFSLAPFGAFMFGSHMNHATTLLWLLVAWVGVLRATTMSAEEAPGRPFWGLVAGLGFGMAATIRPLDGAAFALPAATWLLWNARTGGRAIGTALMAGIGVLLPLAVLFWVNHETTGSALLFAYEQLWGPAHAIGFHPAPWGPDHTPLRGFELLSLNMGRLSTYLFETPFPGILPVVFGLWGAQRPTALDRYLLAGAGVLVAGYWAYWHDGLYLGPRFYFPLLPIAVVWSARATVGLGHWVDGRPLRRIAVLSAVICGVVYAGITVGTVRAPQYTNNMQSIRADVSASARAAGVHDALVLVKESWAAQLIARMWAMDVPRSGAERLFRTVDICDLARGVHRLEVTGIRGNRALQLLKGLQQDSAKLIFSPYSPDRYQRIVPGRSYPAECVEGFRTDKDGFAHLAPMRLLRDGNVYVRWFPGREDEIAGYFPGRPVYLLGRTSAAFDAPFRWTRLF